MKIYKELDRQDREAARNNTVPEYQRTGEVNMPGGYGGSSGNSSANSSRGNGNSGNSGRNSQRN